VILQIENHLHMFNSNNLIKYGIGSVFALIILMFVGSAIFTFYGYQNKQEITTTVVGKERIVEGMGDSVHSYYLVYTEDGTLKLEDDLFYMNFESSDWYGKIRIDSTYTFKTVGYRIGVLSSYPNIVGFE
jgi:hypothetical protein